MFVVLLDGDEVVPDAVVGELVGLAKAWDAGAPTINPASTKAASP